MRIPKSSIALVTLAAVLPVLVGGCKMHAIPNPIPLKPSIAPELKASSAVSVINDQPATEEVEIGTAGLGEMRGSLNEWTATAVTMVKTELTNRGIVVADGSPKSLKLAITSAELQSGAFKTACTVKMQVKMGNGETVPLEGVGSSMQPPKAADAAVYRAVEAVLTDPKIQAYLLR